VNKMDRPGADLGRTLDMVRERLAANPVAVQMPIGVEAELRGVVDLVEMRAVFFDEEGEALIAAIPEEIEDKAQASRERLVAQLADLDDEIAVLYLEGGAVSAETIGRVLRRETLAGNVVPFLCGTSLRNIGVPCVLDAIIAYLPSPVDVPATTGTVPGSEQVVVCSADPKEPAAALVFKIVTDPYMGRMAYFRVYSGIIRRGHTLLNGNTGDSERTGRIVRVHASHREQVDAIGAGDIGAVLGFKAVGTGDTLCDPSRPVLLEKIAFPVPVVSLAVEPRSKSDQDKLGVCLQRLSDEDPTIHVRQDERTGQTIVSGMGELHLEVFVERMKREFHVDAQVGEPRVAYCETITRPYRVDYRLKRQSGGHGQFAEVELELEPLPADSGFVFEDALRGSSIPRNYLPAIEKGVRDALQCGPLTDSPVIDIKVRVVDGKYHEVDSSDLAFRVAATKAVREGVVAAAPVVLEPIMCIEVVMPEAYTGDVMGELRMRRATISSLEGQRATKCITADVPLATMFGYAGSLRSRTQGRGTFTMEFDHYAPVSEAVQRMLTVKKAA